MVVQSVNDPTAEKWKLDRSSDDLIFRRQIEQQWRGPVDYGKIGSIKDG